MLMKNTINFVLVKTINAHKSSKQPGKKTAINAHMISHGILEEGVFIVYVRRMIPPMVVHPEKIDFRRFV